MLCDLFLSLPEHIANTFSVWKNTYFFMLSWLFINRLLNRGVYEQYFTKKKSILKNKKFPVSAEFMSWLPKGTYLRFYISTLL